MRVLFVHRNYPAHFGHIAAHLTHELGWECILVSEHAGLGWDMASSDSADKIRSIEQYVG